MTAPKPRTNSYCQPVAELTWATFWIAGASDPGDAPEAVEPGASGIFLKSEALERPVQAIILVADGAVWLDQRIPRRLANQSERLVRLEDRSSSDHTWPSRSKNGL